METEQLRQYGKKRLLGHVWGYTELSSVRCRLSLFSRRYNRFCQGNYGAKRDLFHYCFFSADLSGEKTPLIFLQNRKVTHLVSFTCFSLRTGWKNSESGSEETFHRQELCNNYSSREICLQVGDT